MSKQPATKAPKSKAPAGLGSEGDITNPKSMTLERVSIDAIHRDEKNANVGDTASIMDSLLEFGQHRPAVVQRSTGKIITGNHMHEAAELLGWTEIDVVYVDDDETKSIRRGIADNATGRRGDFDRKQLQALVDKVGEDIPGLDTSLLDKMVEDLKQEVEQNPIYPICARAGEHYTYVLVVAQNDIDAAWLETSLDVRQEKSYKSQGIGRSKVVTVERFRSMIPALAAQITESADA